MPGKRKVQVTLTLMPGAEMWVRVEHPTGWFKVPGSVTIQEVLAGALIGWSGEVRGRKSGEATVRVPLSVWLKLNADHPGE